MLSSKVSICGLNSKVQTTQFPIWIEIDMFSVLGQSTIVDLIHLSFGSSDLFQICAVGGDNTLSLPTFVLHVIEEI